MDRFYVKKLGPIGSQVELSPEEARHMKVLRLGPGSELELFDGSGAIARARLTKSADRASGAAQVEILELIEAPPDAPVDVTLASAIPKGSRMAELLRGATEAGIAAFIPMVAERSAVRPPIGYASERWDRIAREAVKQSRRARIPDISVVQTFEGALARMDGCELKVMADSLSDAGPLREVLPPRGSVRKAAVLVGPEGGFTMRERELAERRGFIRARLECPIMRIETAGAVLVAVIIFACG